MTSKTMARSGPFSSLFSLRRSRIDIAFKKAEYAASIPGIKVLHAAADEGVKVLVVPTRTCKGHVQRNLVRRRIKSIIYENQLATAPGTTLILLYQQSLDLSFDELTQFLIRAFRKINR